MIESIVSHSFLYASPAADVCLLAIFVAKKRWTHFPAFFLLILADLLFTLCLNLLPPSNGNRYEAFYYSFDLTDVFLQIWVVFELLSKVIPKNHVLAASGRQAFLLFSVAGGALALFAAFLLSPPSLQGLSLLALRADVFTSLLICETVIAILLAANKIGIGWRNHVLAIAQGLMFWAILAVVIEGLGIYLQGIPKIFPFLFYARVALYLAAIIYWSVALWREEPARKPISPALRKYIVALHDQVQYDLGKTGH